jgi:hypothetical protein
VASRQLLPTQAEALADRDGLSRPVWYRFWSGVNDALAAVGNALIGGDAGATDNAALRADGTGGITLQASPLIIADTTGALSRSGNGGIPVQGTNTNDAATAGYVGENIEAAATQALTTATPANVTSISLTAGDWDVSALGTFSGAGATNTTNIALSISNTSATQDTTTGRHCAHRINGGSGHLDYSITFAVPAYRITLTATTTIYLVATASFSASTYGCAGRIAGRRTR